jgi:hypothetical protein
MILPSSKFQFLDTSKRMIEFIPSLISKKKLKEAAKRIIRSQRKRRRRRKVVMTMMSQKSLHPCHSQKKTNSCYS